MWFSSDLHAFFFFSLSLPVISSKYFLMRDTSCSTWSQAYTFSRLLTVCVKYMLKNIKLAWQISKTWLNGACCCLLLTFKRLQIGFVFIRRIEIRLTCACFCGSFYLPLFKKRQLPRVLEFAHSPSFLRITDCSDVTSATPLDALEWWVSVSWI